MAGPQRDPAGPGGNPTGPVSDVVYDETQEPPEPGSEGNRH